MTLLIYNIQNCSILASVQYVGTQTVEELSGNWLKLDLYKFTVLQRFSQEIYGDTIEILQQLTAMV